MAIEGTLPRAANVIRVHSQTNASDDSTAGLGQLDLVESLLLQGNCARDGGKLIEAVTKYEQARKIKDNEWRAYYGIGNVFSDQALVFDRTTLSERIDQTSLARAIEAYLQAISLSRQDPLTDKMELAELYSDLSQAYLRSTAAGSRAKALDAVNTAIGLNPKSASAHRRLGNISFRDDIDDAIREYTESLRLDSQNALTHQALAAAYFQKARAKGQQADYRSAISEYKIVASLRPDDAKAVEYVAMTYFYAGSFAEAIDGFKQALEMAPDHAKAYDFVGQAYFALRKYRDAIDWFQKATIMAPNLLESRHKLSLSYCYVGDSDSARKEYERLNTLDAQAASQLRLLIQNCPVSNGRPN